MAKLNVQSPPPELELLPQEELLLDVLIDEAIKQLQSEQEQANLEVSNG